MRKLSLMLITILILILILSVFPAAAESPHYDVSIEALLWGWPPEGTFTASGPAVLEGMVCISGDLIASSANIFGKQTNQIYNVQVVYLFTCDDGSGEFSAKLQARIINGVGTEFTWIIVDGSDEYEDLHGSGTGIGIWPEDPQVDVIDTYNGKVH